MSDDELRHAVDGIVARLQSELQGQISQLQERHHHAREAARQEAEARTVEAWTAKLGSAHQEFEGRMQTALAEATAHADRRVADEAEKAAFERHSFQTEAGEQLQRELAADSDDWQGGL